MHYDISSGYKCLEEVFNNYYERVDKTEKYKYFDEAFDYYENIVYKYCDLSEDLIEYQYHDRSSISETTYNNSDIYNYSENTNCNEEPENNCECFLYW